MRRRLLLVTLAVTSLLVAAFAVPLGLLVRDVARDRAITDAERDLAALAPVLSVTAEAPLLDAAMQRTSAGAGGRMTLWLPDGDVVGNPTVRDVDEVKLAVERRLAFSRSRPDGMDVYTPVVLGSAGVAVLRVSVPNAILRDGVATAWSILAVLALVLVLMAVAVTDRLGRSVTKPATDLAATSRSLAGGDLGARAEVAGPPEIADAGVALNTLAARITELLASERERVADLSHRLRTPLTALRLSIEGHGDTELSADVDRLEAEVNDLIRTARRPLHEGTTRRSDLAAVTASRAAFWGALADDDGRTWSCTVDPSGPMMVGLSGADAVAAIDVLLGNVFSHTPDGSPYAVKVEAVGEQVVFTLDDAGDGIADPAGALGRGVSAGGSTGLGLDIAASAARSAGGAIRIERSPLGGARIVLDLPAVRAPG